MTDKDLFEIALKYVDKDYSYEQLKNGDDLYGAKDDYKETCLAYYEDIKEQGSQWANAKIQSFTKGNDLTKIVSSALLNSSNKGVIVGFKEAQKAINQFYDKKKELSGLDYLSKNEMEMFLTSYVECLENCL